MGKERKREQRGFVEIKARTFTEFVGRNWIYNSMKLEHVMNLNRKTSKTHNIKVAKKSITEKRILKAARGKGRINIQRNPH